MAAATTNNAVKQAAATPDTAEQDRIKEILAQANEPDTVFIPRATDDEDKSFVVRVNGDRYSFPRGTASTVPRYIAEEARRSLGAKVAFDDTVAELADRAH